MKANGKFRRSVMMVVMVFSRVALGSLDLSGQYWFGSLGVETDTNAPWAKRGTASITGNRWDQEWDDYDGRRTFSSVFTTAVQPDGSINVHFQDLPEKTYNIAWNGDMMIYAGGVLHGGGKGIDIFMRKAPQVEVNDLIGDYSFFGHWLGANDRWDEVQWGRTQFNADGVASSDYYSSDGYWDAFSGNWTLDDVDGIVGVSGTSEPALWGEGGVALVIQCVDANSLGYSILVKRTDQVVGMTDIAGIYQVRFLETGPGGVPYTCGQGTCVIEAVDDVNGTMSVDAYYSDGEHSVKSMTCSIGPRSEFHLDDDGVPDGIISPDRNLIFAPEYPYKDSPTREDYDWLGGVFLVRTPDDIVGPDGSNDLDGFSWARRVASNAGEENLITGMDIDSQSDVYVTGWFDGTNDFGGVTLTSRSGTGQDIFVAKYNAAGILQWAQRAGGSDGTSFESDAGRGVGVDAAGNVYVTGQFRSTADFGDIDVTAGSSGSCFFLAKYDPNGAVQWVRHNACPPDRYCAGNGLAVDASGNCYVVGSFDGAAITFGNTTITKPAFSSVNRYLVKYDSDGQVQWAVGIASTQQSMANSVSLDKDGSIFLAGRFRADVLIGDIALSGTSAWNSFVVKLSNSGVPLWAQTITSDGGVQAFGVRADHQGSVYVSGGFGPDAGATASFGPSVTLTSLGGGSAGTDEGDGIGDAFLAKYDAATGAIQWARRAGGTGGDAFVGVTTDTQGNIHTAGGFMSGGDAGEFTIPVTPNWHIVTARYDRNGTAQELNYVETTGGMGLAMALAVDAEENRYLAGWYQGFATFGTNILEPGGTWNYFLAKLPGHAINEISGRWIQLSSMNVARDLFAGAIIGDEIFVFGGNAKDGTDLYGGEKYSIATDSWFDIADNPYGLQRGVQEISGIGCNGRFYVFGAEGAHDSGYDVFNYNQMYDPASDIWTTVATKPTTTSQALPVVYEGEIYLFGGSIPEVPSADRFMRRVEAYNPKADQWRHVGEIPKRLSGRAVAVHGDRAYVIGGYDVDIGAPSYEVMAFDFTSGDWVRNYSTLPAGVPWGYPYATQAPVIDGNVCLIGGVEGEFPEDCLPSDKFTMFDVESKNWVSGPALPEPREGHLTVVSDRTIFVIGGSDRVNDTKDTVFAYALPDSTDIDTAVSVHWLWSATYGRHFYTIDESEKEEFLQDSAGAWHDEGVVYRAFFDVDEPNAAPVYRFFSESLNSYFYMISESERDRLIDDYPDVWKYEKIAFYVFPVGQQPADASPVYRFWSDVLGCHFCTIDESERDNLIDNHSDVWTYEGVAWYACEP